MATEKKILVTGGGGFLGKAIVRRLVARGERVRSFSRRFYPELETLGIEQVRGDIADKTSVKKACIGVDLVFHTAAKPGIWGACSDYYNTNVLGTSNVLEGCLAHGISRFVYTSSPSVVFNGTDMEGADESVPYPEKFHAIYPKTKALAEQLVRNVSQKDLSTIILRPHLIWGPEDNHLVPRIVAQGKKLVRVGDGKNLVDTVYIDNAADAHVLAADKLMEKPELSGKVYFISQGKPVLLWDMIDDILKAAGIEPVRGAVSKRTAWMIGAVFEFFHHLLRIQREPRMTRFLADELATSHWFDISAARNDLGYSPKVTTEEGLKRLAGWLQTKGGCAHI